MSRYFARVKRLENRLGGPAVTRIIRLVERVNDEELNRLNESGDLDRLAQRLSDRQLDLLINEFQ